MRTGAGRPEAAKRPRRPLSRTAVLTAMLGALSIADACGSTSGIDDIRARGDGAPSGGASSGGAASGGVATMQGSPCDPGATRACVGAARCAGGQLCDSTGQWGSCDCGAAGNGGAASGEGGVPTGSGGVPSGGAGGAGLGGAATTGPSIGRACQVNADCGAPGVICMQSASSVLDSGGPANGLCTVDCSADPTVCDATSICVGFATGPGSAFCFEGCSVGPGPGIKCHDRPDQACDDSVSTSASGPGFCRPMCRADSDCGGRKCDIGSGFCKDGSAVTGTLPVGSGCDATAVPDKCRGACAPLGPGGQAGICTGFCSLGGVGCGIDPRSTAVLGAACLFDGTTAGGADVGDLGLCGGLCDCDAQCTAQGRVCVPLPAAEQSAYGRAGYCGGARNSQGQPQNHLATCP